MWPAGISKELLFFAMMAQTPVSELKSYDVHTVRGRSRVLHPNLMHTPYTLTHKTHHLGLPVTSCLEGKSYHSNSHKRGSMVTMIKLLSAYILRNTMMWVHRRARLSFCFFMRSQWNAWLFWLSIFLNKHDNFADLVLDLSFRICRFYF